MPDRNAHDADPVRLARPQLAAGRLAIRERDRDRPRAQPPERRLGVRTRDLDACLRLELEVPPGALGKRLHHPRTLDRDHGVEVLAAGIARLTPDRP